MLARMRCSKPWFLIGLCLWGGSVAAQNQPLFEGDSLLSAELSVDHSAINAGKQSDTRTYQDGSFFWQGPEGAEHQLSVKVRARGNFRRERCDNPPLLLNFKKKQVEGTLLDGQDKLKLVRPCGNNRREEQWVVIEYLIYQAYRKLSEASFKVRPLMLTYSNTERKPRGRKMFGFVIEDEDDLAKRLDGQILNAAKINRGDLTPETHALVDLFQYMIGNNDYSLIRADRGRDCCHNIKLLTAPKTRGLIAIPYDFDFSGLVNASYATPPPGVRIRTVRQRYFRGYCVDQARWQETVALFNSQREQTLALFRDFEPLASTSKRSAISYLESFFDIIGDDKQFKRRITDRCR